MKRGIRAKGRQRSIRVSGRVKAPPERVFGAWLDPEVAGRWLFATAWHPIARVAIDARAGGLFHFVDQRDAGTVEYTGKYLEIVPPRRLVFTLVLKNSRQAATRVSVDFVPLATGCQLVLTHDDLPPDHASRAEARWTGMLYGLAETLDSHADAARPHPHPGLLPSRGKADPRSRRNDEIPVPDLR